MFISCLHAQQPQSIKQFISKLPCRTALNYTTHVYRVGQNSGVTDPQPQLCQIPTIFFWWSRERERDGRKWTRFSGSEVSWLCEDSVRWQPSISLPWKRVRCHDNALTTTPPCSCSGRNRAPISGSLLSSQWVGFLTHQSCPWVRFVWPNSVPDWLTEALHLNPIRCIHSLCRCCRYRSRLQLLQSGSNSHLSVLPVQLAERGLWNGTVSVRLSAAPLSVRVSVPALAHTSKLLYVLNSGSDRYADAFRLADTIYVYRYVCM